MGAATVGTIIITAVIVVVLATFLITIGLRLQKLSFTLGTIIVGLRAIREQTRPVGEVLTGIVGDVTDIEDALGGVLTAVGGVAAPAEAESMADAVARARGEAEFAEQDEYDEEEEEEEAAQPEPVRPRITARRQAGTETGMEAAVARARERMAVRG